MSHQNPIQAMLQQGLLPYLFGKMGLQPQNAGAASPQDAPPHQDPYGKGGVTAPQNTPTQRPAIPSGQGQPQSQPPGAGGGGTGGGASPTKAVYDASGAAGTMGAPTPQPISQINSLQDLLMQWNQRKDAKKQAEAANIAQKLMQAIKDKDVDMVHDILNDKHSTGILDKVYKGWLTKAQEAQKPGEKPDPVMQGFEQGITQSVSQGQQRPMPQTMGGYRLPQAGPQQQFDAAKLSAAMRQAQGDPDLMKPTQLTSGEERKVQLGSGPERVDAEVAAAHSRVLVAQSNSDRASYESRKAQTEYQREVLRGQTEGKRDEAKLSELNAQVKKANLQVDVENARLQREKMKALNQTMASKADQHRLQMADQAVKILSQPQFTLSNQNIPALSALLRQAGAISIAKALDDDAKAGFMKVHFGAGRSYKTNQDVIDAITEYKNGLTGTKKEAGGEETEGGDEGEGTPPSDAEPKEGDVVDGYRFKGGDPAVQDNWEEVPPEKK